MSEENIINNKSFEVIITFGQVHVHNVNNKFSIVIV